MILEMPEFSQEISYQKKAMMSRTGSVYHILPHHGIVILPDMRVFITLSRSPCDAHAMTGQMHGQRMEIIRHRIKPGIRLGAAIPSLGLITMHKVLDMVPIIMHLAPILRGEV